MVNSSTSKMSVAPPRGKTDLQSETVLCQYLCYNNDKAAFKLNWKQPETVTKKAF